MTFCATFARSPNIPLLAQRMPQLLLQPLNLHPGLLQIHLTLLKFLLHATLCSGSAFDIILGALLTSLQFIDSFLGFEFNLVLLTVEIQYFFLQLCNLFLLELFIHLQTPYFVLELVFDREIFLLKLKQACNASDSHLDILFLRREQVATVRQLTNL